MTEVRVGDLLINQEDFDTMHRIRELVVEDKGYVGPYSVLSTLRVSPNPAQTKFEHPHGIHNKKTQTPIFATALIGIQLLVNGKEEDFRAWHGLASSSQPVANQPEPAPPASLAVPLHEAPIQTQGCQAETNVGMPIPEPHEETDINVTAYDAQSPWNSSASFMPPISVPEPVQSQSFDILLTLIVPEPQVRRYERHVPVDSEHEPFEIKRGFLDYSEELVPVAGWEPLVHPEGALFLYQPYKRVLTDANVRDPETTSKIDKAIEKAYEEARNANTLLDPFVELGLELVVEDGKDIWGYYFADHQRRVIFWFEDYKIFELMDNVRVVKRKSHVKKVCIRITVLASKGQQVFHAVQDCLVIENMTTKMCTMPFTLDEVANSTNKKREHSVWISARFMKLFCARLVADQSLYGGCDTRPKHVSAILHILNIIIILLGSSDAHSKAVHKAWVDGTIVNDRLRGKNVVSFMEKVSRSILGLESLSLMFSLPFALLMWSMISFTVALTVVISNSSGIIIIWTTYSVWNLLLCNAHMFVYLWNTVTSTATLKTSVTLMIPDTHFSGRRVLSYSILIGKRSIFEAVFHTSLHVLQLSGTSKFDLDLDLASDGGN
ncbi:hypothetical protein BDR07DRAFT_1382676 [Suillus spraguei]|nr:hypothetical protein BDR07DRAFT_1382676 [Suillus spraguei]